MLGDTFGPCCLMIVNIHFFNGQLIVVNFINHRFNFTVANFMCPLEWVMRCLD